MGRSVPIHTPIAGAPVQPQGRVRVVAVTDAGIHDVSAFLGAEGTVEYLEYTCGSGQSFPGDPMIGVRFEDGALEEFWFEELNKLPGETPWMSLS